MRRLVGMGLVLGVLGVGAVLAQGAPPSIDVPLKTGLSAPGDVAVVIGNEDYYKLSDVPYARADATAFETFLKYTRGVPLDRLRTVRDGSREQMLAAVEEMAAKKPTGIFWIYYAGHGMGDPNSPDPKVPERLLLGGDAAGTVEQIAASGVRVKELQAAAAAGGGQVVMVVDACYNGGSRGGESVSGGARVAVPESLVTAAGVVEWAASAPSQLAMPLASVGHGAFTYLAIGALRGWADGQKTGSADGVVTLEEAQMYVEEQLSTMQLTSQQPQVGGGGLGTALSGRAGARLEAGPSPDVVRGLAGLGEIGGGSSGGGGSVVVIQTATKAWTAGDDTVLKGMVDTERERLIVPVREAQMAEVSGLVSARQQEVSREWAALKGAFGDPAKASASAVAAVEQKIAEWKRDSVSAAARRVTLSGSVSWNGRTQALSGTVEVPGQAVAVSHSATLQAAEAWLAVARSSGGSSGSDWTSPTLGKMKWIKPGTFTMGSPAGEAGRDGDETQHQVTLTKGFWLMEHEVTQGEWQAVMGSNPAYFKNCGSTCPVEQVNWDDIQTYIQKVSARDGVAYRLPTEAEWEYAARGGQAYIYAGSNDLGAVGWYDSNSNSTTHPGCQKQHNGHGLCDMSGNVWEWVQDWHGTYPGSTSDYVNNSSGGARVVRGGGWNGYPSYARVADRGWYTSDIRYSGIGFRLARSP